MKSAVVIRAFTFPATRLNRFTARATLEQTTMGRTDEDIQDELLVLHCQEGDGIALRELIGRWGPRFGRLAWRFTGEREAARDVTQDAWLAIVRGIKRLDDPARFRSWAYRIVHRKCVDWTRRRVLQRRVTDDLRDAAAAASKERWSESERADVVDRMREALMDLPDGQRAILSMHYLDGMSVAEIAGVLAVPKGTAKSRLFHARERLRIVLERVTT